MFLDTKLTQEILAIPTIIQYTNIFIKTTEHKVIFFMLQQL